MTVWWDRFLEESQSEFTEYRFIPCRESQLVLNMETNAVASDLAFENAPPAFVTVVNPSRCLCMADPNVL